MARIIQNFQMQPGWIALLQFESPYAQGSVMQAVTAWDAAELPQAARLLWDPSLQALCGGDATFLRLDSPKEAVSLQAGRRFFMGDAILPPEIGKLLHYSLLLVAAGAVAICAVAAYVAHWILARARREKKP